MTSSWHNYNRIILVCFVYIRFKLRVNLVSSISPIIQTETGWTTIYQTTFSNVFSSMKMFVFRLQFHRGLFLSVQLIMTLRHPGDKPLSEPMMVSLPTHMCHSALMFLLADTELFPADWIIWCTWITDYCCFLIAHLRMHPHILWVKYLWSIGLTANV